MSFVYPWFLWALLAISVPILIHLFYFRRFKTVYFTNVRFLKEVKEQTSAREKLKHLLVLAMRIGAIVFLALAFAMPFIPDSNAGARQGARDLSIYFDNSFSMSAESQDVRLLEKARRRAEELIEALDPEDRIQILTADFEGRDQRLLSKEEALSRLREVRTSYHSRELSKVLTRQKQAVNTGENPNKELFIISDFQQNATDIQNYQDTSYRLYLIPLQSVQVRNVAIDTAWFEAPVQSVGEANRLIVQVQNYSEQTIDQVRLSLELDGQERPAGLLNLGPRAKAYDTINVTISTVGWHEAKITLQDFPIEFDNHYQFSFYVAERIRILSVYEGKADNAIRAAFAGSEYIELQQQAVGQLDYSKIGTHDLVVLENLKSVPTGLASDLQAYVRNGGNVLFFPAAQGNTADYANLCQNMGANILGTWDPRPRTVSFINYDEFVFRDVFEERRENIRLPNTKANYRLQKRASSGEEQILRYRDGETFVGKYNLDRGHFFLSTAPLDRDYSDLISNGDIFVPMLYRMAISRGQSRKIAYTIGQDNSLESDYRGERSTETVYKLGNKGNEFIPEQKIVGSRLVLGLNNQIQEAGIYNLFLLPEEVLDKFAFNYDRRESDMAFFSEADLAERFGPAVSIIEGTYAQDFAQVVSAQSKGTQLWKYCLILSLIFLLLETLVLRLWRIEAKVKTA